MGTQLLKATSTQDALKLHLLEHPECENFYWIQAIEQEHGRGRQEREWSSPRGGLYLSFLLRGPLPFPVTWISHRTALALRDMILSTVLNQKNEKQLKIKWPNDLIFITPDHPQKLAGIIVEKVGEQFIVGVGLNVNSAPTLDRPITSLKSIIENELVVDQVRDAFLKQIQIEFTNSALQDNYQNRYQEAQYFTLDQKIEWESGTGEMLRIGEYGELIVKLSNGQEKALYSEDVHLLTK